MHRILILLVALLWSTGAQADYLSQRDMLEVLERGGTTPEAMGMIPLRVCYVVGERPGTPTMKYPRQVTSHAIYQRLREQADIFNRLQPAYRWEVRCVREWHQVTPQLRRSLTQSMVIPETKESAVQSTARAPTSQQETGRRVLRTVNAPWDKLSDTQRTEVLACRLLWNNQRIKGCTYE